VIGWGMLAGLGVALLVCCWVVWECLTALIAVIMETGEDDH